MGDELDDDFAYGGDLLKAREGDTDLVEGESDSESSSGDSEEGAEEERVVGEKRKEAPSSSSSSSSTNDAPKAAADYTGSFAEPVVASAKKAKKEKKQHPVKTQSNESLLIETGRTITDKGVTAHAAFFNACYLSEFPTSSPASLPASKFAVHPLQTVTARPVLDATFVEFLKATLLSKESGGSKRLKKHKSISPLCIIISSGALRSCQVLKTLGPLKARVAKLFSKNMNAAEQSTLLKTTYNPFAVGTPNRLLKLLRTGALDLSSTELVVLDTHSDQKGFNVVTLRDTRKDLMDIVKDFVAEKDSVKLCLY